MNQYLSFSIQTAENASQELMKHYKTTPPITRGSPKEVKSLFDRVADDIIKKAIEESYSTHSYLTEETGFVQKEDEYLWVIDPLDGTGNFVNGNPFFAISIALFKNNKPYLGLIEAPELKERYYAMPQKGAFHVDLNTSKESTAQISETTDIQKSYIVSCEGGIKEKAKGIPIIKQFYSDSKDFRKLGSAALELAWVGVSRADAYITTEISLWDIAAGMIFVEEAGGKNLDFSLNPYKWKNLLQMENINLVSYNGKLNLSPIDYQA